MAKIHLTCKFQSPTTVGEVDNAKCSTFIIFASSETIERNNTLTSQFKENIKALEMLKFLRLCIETALKKH